MKPRTFSMEQKRLMVLGLIEAQASGQRGAVRDYIASIQVNRSVLDKWMAKHPELKQVRVQPEAANAIAVNIPKIDLIADPQDMSDLLDRRADLLQRRNELQIEIDALNAKIGSHVQWRTN